MATDLDPQFSISSDQEHCEVHFTISGVWAIEPINEFLLALSKAASPLNVHDRPINVLGVMKGFVPQSHDVSDAIRTDLAKSQKHGLSRVGICGASPIVKMQYAGVSLGIEVAFFNDRHDALRWMRRPYRSEREPSPAVDASNGRPN